MEFNIEGRADVERALIISPDAEKALKKIIVSEVKKARANVMSSFAGSVTSDPRHARNAVKMAVYRKILGANMSIFSRRRATGKKTTYVRPRKLDANPHQRGGNRMPRRSEVSARIDMYDGVDRAFVLRWLGGTAARRTSTRGTGAIGNKFNFDAIASREFAAAVERIKALITVELNKK